MTTTPSDTEERGTDGGKRSGAGRRGQAVLIVAAVAAAFHLYGVGVAPFTALVALLVASALYLAEERDALAQVHGMVRQIDMASLLDAPVSLHAVTQAWVDANLAGGSR